MLLTNKFDFNIQVFFGSGIFISVLSGIFFFRKYCNYIVWNHINKKFNKTIQWEKDLDIYKVAMPKIYFGNYKKKSKCILLIGGFKDIPYVWEDFEKFYADMGDRPEGMTLERINNNLSYSKDNCVWATYFEQNRNTRQNVILEKEGKRMCLTDWAEELGVPYPTLQDRVRRGWSTARVLQG